MERTMKTILPVLISSILIACTAMVGYYPPPKNVDSASQKIEYAIDEFEGHAWLRTADYLGEFETGYNSGVIYRFRAFYGANGKLQFTQLYITVTAPGWYFMKEAVLDSGAKLDLTLIDKQATGGVIHEDMAINLTISELETFVERDRRIKLKGKRGDGVFTVSKYVAEAFLIEILNRQPD